MWVLTQRGEAVNLAQCVSIRLRHADDKTAVVAHSSMTAGGNSYVLNEFETDQDAINFINSIATSANAHGQRKDMTKQPAF